MSTPDTGSRIDHSGEEEPSDSEGAAETAEQQEAEAEAAAEAVNLADEEKAESLASEYQAEGARKKAQEAASDGQKGNSNWIADYARTAGVTAFAAGYVGHQSGKLAWRAAKGTKRKLSNAYNGSMGWLKDTFIYKGIMKVVDPDGWMLSRDAKYHKDVVKTNKDAAKAEKKTRKEEKKKRETEEKKSGQVSWKSYFGM